MHKRKTLIVYYSWSGNTRLVAEQLAEKTGAGLFKLETAKTYPPSQKDIDATVNRELESGNLPELKAWPGKLSSYDLVLLGGPVWMYTVATPVMRFLSETDFVGAMLAPFCTHQGGPGHYFAHFRQQARNARLLEGIDFYSPAKNRETTARKMDEWLVKLSAV